MLTDWKMTGTLEVVVFFDVKTMRPPPFLFFGLCFV